MKDFILERNMSQKEFELYIKDLLSLKAGGKYTVQTFSTKYTIKLPKNFNPNVVKTIIKDWLSVEGRIA
jgi:hypothetical protein